MFHSQDIFVFLWNLQISKFVTYTLLHNESYTFAYFIWILSTVKMKFSQILVYLMTRIYSMFLAQCWRLETSSRRFFILMKWQYNKIYHFFVVDVYCF